MEGLMRGAWILVVVVISWTTSARAEIVLDGYASLSHAFFDMPADGHGPSVKGAITPGLGVEVAKRIEIIDVGVGLHYDVGSEQRYNVHFFSLPLIFRLVFPLSTPGKEIRLNVGVGLGMGYFEEIYTMGLSYEGGIGYHAMVSKDVGWHFLVGVRYENMRAKNAPDDSYLRNGELTHLQLPFLRAGASWR
jgi:hypothetical protein